MIKLFKYSPFVFLLSCGADFLEEEDIPEMPETVEEDFPKNMEEYSKPESPIIEFDSLTQINSEHIKGPAIIREYPNDQISMKIHSEDVLVHCSSEKAGDWKLIGIEVDETLEFREVNKGNVWQEIYKNGELFATSYYVKDKHSGKRKPYFWYDDNFIRGYTYKTNIAQNTIPERELERIITDGDLTKKAFDQYLWLFQFQDGGTELGSYEDIQQFYLFPAHIDGRSAPNRLLLIFQDDELIAVKHDRSVYLSGKKSIECKFGLSLLIVADWDEQKKEQFTTSISGCTD